MRKLAVLAAVALATLGIAHPARATTTVHLTVDLGAPGGVEEAECEVTVASNANGIDVLEAAIDDDCIDTYDTEPFSEGEYVSCINDICEQPEDFPVVSWLIYLEDGSFAPFGVEELSFPTDGDTLSFAYEAWPVHAPCFFFNLLCP